MSRCGWRTPSCGGVIACRRSPYAAISTNPSSHQRSPWSCRARCSRSWPSSPAGYRIEMAGSIEESAKANVALAAVFPIMVALMLTIIMFQVRSFSATSMVMLTAPLGLIGAVPVLLLFHQPFGFNAILGLIGLAGIIMRNTLILIGQIHTNQQHGLDPYHAVVEATVQRARPVILTALAAVLAFIPLTR